MASQLNTSPTGSNQNVSGGATAWSNPTNVATSNNVRAMAAMAALGSSQDLRALFTFSIPPTAVLDGYVCEAEISASGTNVFDGPIRLWHNGSVVGTDHDMFEPAWPTTEQYKSWGGATDNWGVSLTGADANSGTLGFSICADCVIFAARVASCDHMRMTVYYTELSGWSRWARGPLRGVLRGVFRTVRAIQGWYGVPPERRWLVQAAHGQMIGAA